MNIVILHCHYQRGGVTQVVENHVRWLRDCDEVARIVLVADDRWSGLSADTRQAVELVSVSGFDYDDREYAADALEPRSKQIFQQLQDSLADVGIDRHGSVMHWHNYGLGKNTSFPATIRHLAQAGWRLLLQIHDYAEDNRPDNYRRLISACGAEDRREIGRYLYPVAPQIHYATLTRGDAETLIQMGVPKQQAHCLPNSVVAPTSEPPERARSISNVRRAMRLDHQAGWCIYPVRGIRRKNVGEFLLLSRWLRPNQYAGLTLRPTTPVEQRSYDRWKSFASQVSPCAIFDAGHHDCVTFADNLSAADHVISTSVAEGFGMAFLEPWLVRREVIARDLPGVTDDFQHRGVNLPKLYDRIPIPGDPSWVQSCEDEYRCAESHAWSRLPAVFRPREQVDQRMAGDSIDFARLTVSRQMNVLRRIAEDPAFESAVKQRSALLCESLTSAADPELVEANYHAVSKQYAPQTTGRQLLGIYESLASAEFDADVQSPPQADRAVDLITKAKPYYPCRTEVVDA